VFEVKSYSGMNLPEHGQDAHAPGKCNFVLSSYEQMNKAFVGRELKMVELKGKISALVEQQKNA
jgi:hypothetical protein